MQILEAFKCGSLNGTIFMRFFLLLSILFLAPDAFASPASSDQFTWRYSKTTGAYKVYDPLGHLSPQFNNGTSFTADGSGGVIDTVPPTPLTFDGVTGEVIPTISRDISNATLIDSMGNLLKLDNPVGLAILSATALAPLLLDAYDSANPSSSSTPSGDVSCTASSSSAVSGGLDIIQGYSPPYCSSVGVIGTPSAVSSLTNYPACVAPSYSSSSSVTFISPSSCPSGSSPASSPAPSVTSSQVVQWADSNWPVAGPAIGQALITNPADAPLIAYPLSNNNAPLPAPVPYDYGVTPNPDILTGPSTTNSSTDPSGNTTNTTTTPQVRVTPAPNGNGLNPQQVTKTITNTCTTSGSCTQNTDVVTSPTTSATPSPFVAPTVSFPSSGLPDALASMPTSAPFSNIGFGSSWLPQTCPPAPTWLVSLPFGYSHTFTLPTSYICQLAGDFKPVVLASGGILSLMILAW